MNERHLGGDPLLEVYIIDVGQGDGILIVTPEGHHLMIDGGNIRKNQKGGKNAADFVDWKFSRDYATFADRADPDKASIRLDSLIASHNDLDHFGGLWDLIEKDVNGDLGLKKFPDGYSKNTNGHSVVLRLDYTDRRIMLTGDLNTHSQHHIIDTFGTEIIEEFKSDVAKGCHHGGHDVSYKFLAGLRPLVTIISSGDAETHDHPRPIIVAASTITGRRLIDTETDHLTAPMVYLTEVARSVSIAKIGKMGQYPENRPAYERDRPKGATKVHDTDDEMRKFRLFLGPSQSSAFDWPRLDLAKAVKGIRYGLINVRTDGKPLFAAQKEKAGGDWAYHVLTDKQISKAH